MFQLAPEEAHAILACYPASQAWGYNAGPESDHVAYELLTHTPGIYGMQAVSDLVFRNIVRVHEQQGLTIRHIYSSDMGWYRDVASSLEDDTPLDRRGCVELLRTFFATEPHARMLLCGLARHTTEGATIAFATVVTAARALFALAADDFRAAHTLFVGLQNYRENVLHGVAPQPEDDRCAGVHHREVERMWTMRAEDECLDPPRADLASPSRKRKQPSSPEKRGKTTLLRSFKSVAAAANNKRLAP